MPNYCNYEMKIVGSKSAIDKVIECLRANYDYRTGKVPHEHFFRVFQCEIDEELVDMGNDIYLQHLWGDCAWSVFSCMCSGEGSYYDSVKKDYPEIFKGTTLAEQSKNCCIEGFSEEPGVGFSEHYIYYKGECLCDKCEELEQVGYDKDGNITNDIDWDTYDGDIEIDNPNRCGFNEDYRWKLK